MARRLELEGRVFLICQSNGVMAITPLDYSRETAELVKRLCNYYSSQKWTSAEAEKTESAALETVLCKPVFTFARTERVKDSPWFTGDFPLLQVVMDYIRERGGEIRETEFYVPFSKGNELGIHGIKALQDELRWITTDTQFEEEFGITRTELLARMPVA